jgi:D-alanyl-lipoteichoic acid acyltransferase DltB (MBOAT superfamily)
MLFNSYAFILGFLPPALALFFILGRLNRVWAAAWLALASIAFYGYWSPKYIALLLGSVAFNFLCGRAIAKRAGSTGGRRILTASVAVNLILLGFYKYADFFASSVNELAKTDLPLLHVALPIGISFFTFTQIAFLADAGKGIVKEYRFVHYLLFVCYFPHLIAGPILHHAEMMPQFASAAPYRFSTRCFGVGLTVFTIGLAKKVLIADPFGNLASPIFAAAHAGVPIRLIAAWVGVLAFTCQLYFDFSGYSDMAIGISKLFGIDLPVNFASPYKSTSIIQFWQRWHMTLSRFLRDYLYFPLGGNRKGKLRRYVNLMTTMLLGGLWHGANYTFLIWGGLHGCYLMINHAWRCVFPHRRRSFARTLASGAATFLAVSAAWIFFRAEDIPSAFNLLRGITGFNGIAVHQGTGAFSQEFARVFPQVAVVPEGVFQRFQLAPSRVEMAVRFLCAAVMLLAMPNTRQIAERVEGSCASPGSSRFFRYAVPGLAGVLLIAALSQMQKVSAFLYFQF